MTLSAQFTLTDSAIRMIFCATLTRTGWVSTCAVSPRSMATEFSPAQNFARDCRVWIRFLKTDARSASFDSASKGAKTDGAGVTEFLE